MRTLPGDVDLPGVTAGRGWTTISTIGRFLVEVVKTVVCAGHPLVCAHLTAWVAFGPHAPNPVPLAAMVLTVGFLLGLTTTSVVCCRETLGPRRFAISTAVGVVLYAVVAFSAPDPLT